ncbi:MAG: c-type cytochrome domain-containing protein [Chthoniobacteraceae bacterium]
MPRRFPHRSQPFLAVPLLIFSVVTLTAHAAGVPAAAQKAFLWRPFLAPFHAVVLHFPIGFVTMVCVLEIHRRWRPCEALKPVTKLTLWLSLLSGIAAATFGILRATGGGYEAHEVESHRWTGIAVVVTTLLALVVQRFAYRNEARRLLTFTYRVLLAVTLALLVIAGHIGGNLTHGSKYLTENAPAFMRDFLEGKSADSAADASPANLDAKQKFFAERVQPILEKKCMSCHGKEKQKGDYRLDDPVVALKGGESGKAAIKPGDPLGSEVVRLILLPTDDDDVMPPKGKEAMSAEEVLTIIRWIQKGAPFATAAPAAPVMHEATGR